MSNEIIYTDGACSKNGTAKSTGGFGMFISESAVFSSPLKINRKGFHMTFDDEKSGEQTFYVTNIRMEGLAIVSTLALYADALIHKKSKYGNTEVLQKLNALDVFSTNGLKCKYDTGELKVPGAQSEITIEIVTDSLFWMNVVQLWMPSWIKKKMLMQKKNPDILLMLYYLTELFSQNGINIKFTHVKSHQKGARTFHADGNDVADVLATKAVQNANTLFCLN